MEWWFIGLAALVILGALEHQVASIRRDLARLDRKLALVFQQLNVSIDEFPALSERFKELALDPERKIEAIKVYREETGAGLADAKDAVEAFIASVSR